MRYLQIPVLRLSTHPVGAGIAKPTRIRIFSSECMDYVLAPYERREALAPHPDMEPVIGPNLLKFVAKSAARAFARSLVTKSKQ